MMRLVVFERDRWGVVFIVCIASVGLRRPPLQKSTLADANRHLANKVAGVHQGFRAFHAKAPLWKGTFPSFIPKARICRSALFNAPASGNRALLDGRGMPTVPDGSPADAPWHRHQVYTWLAEVTRHGDQFVQFFPVGDRGGLS